MLLQMQHNGVICNIMLIRKNSYRRHPQIYVVIVISVDYLKLYFAQLAMSKLHRTRSPLQQIQHIIMEIKCQNRFLSLLT